MEAIWFGRLGNGSALLAFSHGFSHGFSCFGSDHLRGLGGAFYKVSDPEIERSFSGTGLMGHKGWVFCASERCILAHWDNRFQTSGTFYIHHQ